MSHDTLATLRQQLQQLQALHASGTLDDAAFATARDRLQQRIVERVMAGEVEAAPAAAAGPRPSRRLVAGAAVAVVLIAAAGYAWKGSPEAWGGGADADPHTLGGEQIAAMVDGLAAKLQADPSNAEGWAMLGRSLTVLGRHHEAVTAYGKAVTLLADGPVRAQLQASLDEARARAGLAPAAPSTSASGGDADGTGQAAADSAITGRVSLARALTGQASPDDTVFIHARPADGNRMPLAILRRQVKDLPADFRLDDSLAMSPAARLSSARQVIVSARVSKSGLATPQPGDLEGVSAIVAPGARAVNVEIDTPVK